MPLIGERRKMLLISIGVGLLAAAGAILLFLGLELVAHLCQQTLMGVTHPVPEGEHLALPGGTARSLRPWLIVLLPALGGLLSGLLVYSLAPEAEGHGMDATIRAFHQDRGQVRSRVPFIKGLASILTIGSGGSGGREGPIAQIGAGLGSWLADRLRLDDRQRRTFMLAGTAGGIGAIFRAPLGGAISSVELLYREDIESSAVIPCIVSSVTAYTVFRGFISLPFIGIRSATIYTFPDLTMHLPGDLIYAAVLGVVCALSGRLFVTLFNAARQSLFERLPLARTLRPALGGLAVGLIALMATETLGSGHGYLQQAISTRIAGQPASTLLPLAMGFILLALLKMATTSLTIGSGGSGGVFGPSLLIGGLLGAGFGSLCHALLPGFHISPLPIFVVLGMAGFFASVAKAPIGSLVMVSEMTGSYHLIAPLLVVCVVGILVNRRHSIYPSQVATRFDSPAHRSLMVKDILGHAKVGDHYHPAAMPTVLKTMTAKDLRVMLADDRILFPLTVVDESGRPCGILAMGNLRPVYFADSQPSLFLVADMMSPPVTCTPDEDLTTALGKFERYHASRIPVCDADDPRRLLGYLQYQDIMRAYQEGLARLRLPG